MKKTLVAVFAAMVVGAGGAWAQGPYPTAMTDGTYGPVGSVTPASNSAGGSEYEIYNAVNQLLGTSYTNNAQIDNLEVTGNTATWQQTGNGGYAVIGLGAANSNTFEVYNAATPGTLINPLGTSFSGNGPIGDGTSSNPYTGTGAVFSSGTQFGLALNSVGIDNVNSGDKSHNMTWYSDTALNSDKMDHMLVYNLSALNGKQVYIFDPNTGTEEPVTLNDPYLVTFEDLPLTGNASDTDYNDLQVLINGAAPIAPVPEPVTLALFTLGLAGFALRRQLGLTGFAV